MATLRKITLENDFTYHIYNRGVERRNLFTNKREYIRAIETISYYRFADLPMKFSKFLVQPKEAQDKLFKKFDTSDNKLVEIIAFCLMPNHFHFLLKQLKDNGISKFVSNFTNSYTKYFNIKHERSGPLVQGMFQAIYVESDEQLIHLSRYIHLNPVASSIIKSEDLESYKWSSLKEYLGQSQGFCEKDLILNFFSSISKYKRFVYDQISLAKELDKIKHLALE